MNKRVTTIIILFVFLLGHLGYCFSSASQDTLHNQVISLNQQIKEAKIEYKNSVRKIKIKRGLLLNRLDKRDSAYKAKLKNIKTKHKQGLLALKKEYVQKYRDLNRQKKEATNKHKAIKRSLDIHQKQIGK